MTTVVKITVGTETLTMEWDGTQASAPIILDGIETGYQTADARHRTEEAVRLALREYCKGEGDGVSVDSLWDDVEYETVTE